MAIFLPAQVQNGVNGSVRGNFWVTKGIYISPDRSFSRAAMVLYPTQAAYVSGTEALYEEDFLLTGQANSISIEKLANFIVEPGMITNVPFFSGGSEVSGF